MSYRRVRIIPGAAARFTRKWYKGLGPQAVMPKEAREYSIKISELEGKVFDVGREYDERIVLRYPPELVETTKDGKKVVAIDLEKDLVEKV